MNELEQFLKSQPLRAVPPEWRAEILTAATAKAPGKKSRSVWQAWLWPSPYAWGALAAAWLVILALNAAGQRQARRDAPPGPAPSEQEIIAALTGLRQELDELSPASKPKSAAPPLDKQPDSPGAWLEPRAPEAEKLA
jgi:hypothetical protein